jgi:hypothetical protein
VDFLTAADFLVGGAPPAARNNIGDTAPEEATVGAGRLWLEGGARCGGRAIWR